jgi:hypothetical protein
MAAEICITTGSKRFNAELNDTPTAQAILKALPINANGNRWGGEIYSCIPVKIKLDKDNSRDILQPGELGYWPQGNAFCIFFGTTPASQAKEIRAASGVNIIGKITDNISALWSVEDGAKIVIEKLSSE